MKVVSADAAVAAIKSGSTVLVDGSGGGVNEPDLLLRAVAERFSTAGEPRDLTLIHPSGMGGVDHFAQPGMVRRVIGGHWAWSRALGALAGAGEIEAFCLPQGVLSHQMRDRAAGGPGVISQIGLGTFVDPRQDGGRLNAGATEALVELIELAGREWLHYRPLDYDVALIRGSVADSDGNLTMDDEGLFAETLSAAQATKNCGGMVIAQVAAVCAPGTLDPRRVKVPGVLIDAVVAHPDQRLSDATASDPTLTGAKRLDGASFAVLPFDERKVIARRAACELRPGDVVNLGFGMPDGVAAVLAEEDQAERVTFTLEQGHIGGIPATGSDFGMARNQVAMVDAGYQFDWYDGGGLDVAVLSFAEVDSQGNVNVSKFGGRLAGVGGFINISQGARRVVFIGTFTAGRQELEFDGELQIVSDGARHKFVAEVEQISFSAAYARRWSQPVIYVTERAVFRLADDGLELIEIAPGADLERDVLARMNFRPRISDRLTVSDPALYRAARGWWGDRG